MARRLYLSRNGREAAAQPVPPRMPPQQDYYYLVTPVGVFWIRPHPSEAGSWRLGLDLPHGKWRVLEEFDAPQSAAWAVADHITGHANWDGLPRSPVDPQELEQWRKGPPPAEVMLRFM